MVYYDRTAKNLIERLPTDTKIRIKEVYTELEFLTTPYDILVANEAVNKLFSKQGCVKVLDVLMSFGIESGLINTAPCLRGILYGWKWLCYLGYDQPWITFWVSVIEKKGDVIFTLSYDIDPCENEHQCDGENCYTGCVR